MKKRRLKIWSFRFFVVILQRFSGTRSPNDPSNPKKRQRVVGFSESGGNRALYIAGRHPVARFGEREAIIDILTPSYGARILATQNAKMRAT